MKFKSEYLSDFIVKYFSEINVKNFSKEKAVKMKLWLSGHVKMNVSQVIRDFRP